MKKILLAALLAIGVSAFSYAQGFQRQTPEEQVAAQKTALSLTDAQSAKLLPLYAAQSKSRDSLFQSANGDFQGVFPKMNAMNAAFNAKVKALLTPEQAVIFQKQVDAQAERMKQFQQGQN